MTDRTPRKKPDRTAPVPKGRIEVFRAGVLRRGWAFRFVAANGEKIAQSEIYRRQVDAIAAANLVKTAFTNVPVTVDPTGLAPNPEGL